MKQDFCFLLQSKLQNLTLYSISLYMCMRRTQLLEIYLFCKHEIISKWKLFNRKLAFCIVQSINQEKGIPILSSTKILYLLHRDKEHLKLYVINRPQLLFLV